MTPTERVVEMASSDMWGDPPTRRDYLSAKLRDGAVCLILGAGVSKPFGLPNWEELLARLYEGHESERPMALDLKRQAEFFKVQFCGSANATFMERVSEALYRKFPTDLESLKRNALLAAISAVVMRSIGRRGSTVISFNYDDLLETFLTLSGVVVQPVSDTNYWRTAASVEIWHPHGFIPSTPKGRASKTIVLDQGDYSLIVGDDSHPWRQRMLTVMRSSICVLVGVSLTDDHMDSLILRAKATHVAVDTSTPYWAVWLTVGVDSAAQAIAKTRGIFPVVFSDFDEIPPELDAIVQRATDTHS